MKEEQIKKILSKFGYEFYREGNSGYFLPVKKHIKFQTKITLDEAKEAFKEEGKTTSGKKTNGLKKNG